MPRLCDLAFSQFKISEAGRTLLVQVSAVHTNPPLMMIEILHDLVYQNPRNGYSIVSIYIYTYVYKCICTYIYICT